MASAPCSRTGQLPCSHDGHWRKCSLGSRETGAVRARSTGAILRKPGKGMLCNAVGEAEMFRRCHKEKPRHGQIGNDDRSERYGWS